MLAKDLNYISAKWHVSTTICSDSKFWGLGSPLIGAKHLPDPVMTYIINAFMRHLAEACLNTNIESLNGVV